MQENINQNRIPEMDILKGIAIILVVERYRAIHSSIYFTWLSFLLLVAIFTRRNQVSH